MRELENWLKRAALLTDSPAITASELGLASEEQSSFPTLRQARADIEIDLIRRALAFSENNVSQTAKLLGVSRPTLYDLMDTHGFRVEKTGEETHERVRVMERK